MTVDAAEQPQDMAKRELFLTVFATGAAVMVIEILGTRIIGPVFGIGLFVWSALLTVTLGALAVGYYAGGILADRVPSCVFRRIVITDFATAARAESTAAATERKPAGAARRAPAPKRRASERRVEEVKHLIEEPALDQDLDSGPGDL